MTDKEFCKVDTEFNGETVDNIKQIKRRSFNGEELKEYVEHCIKLRLVTTPVKKEIPKEVEELFGGEDAEELNILLHIIKGRGYGFFERTAKTTMTARLIEDLHEIGYKIVRQGQEPYIDAVRKSCYAVLDEAHDVVQLYQTEEKANKGLEEFKRSHSHTDFYVDTIEIN